MEFRRIGGRELIIFKRSLRENLERDLDFSPIYVLVGKWKELFWVSEDLERYLMDLEKHPFCVGFYLGYIKKNSFFPSLQFITNFGRYGKRRVFVKEKGELMFTLGRDILKESVIKEEGDPRIGDLVFVLNERGECIGIAEKRKNFYKNVLDIGWYIRHGE